VKRLDFIKSLGIAVGSGMIIPDAKVEKLSLPKHTSNADMNIGVNGVERMRITSSGNILIGTNTDAGYKLVIS
jgi:hypothetical protein